MFKQHPLSRPGMVCLAKSPPRGDKVLTFKYLKVFHEEKCAPCSKRAALTTSQKGRGRSKSSPGGPPSQGRVILTVPGRILELWRLHSNGPPYIWRW